MYCINCGVKLAESEKSCPLCNIGVYHPEIKQSDVEPLYPKNIVPKTISKSKVLNGAIIIMFLIPLIVCFLADIQINGKLEWFGFVAGALGVGYIVFALPLWFEKRNPVIFVPCGFLAAGLYLMYINFVTNGDWFLTFAFPVTGGICIIISAMVALFYYLKKGKLYITGGAFVLFGGFMLLTEFLMDMTFHIRFMGWSIYPLAVLVLIGGLLIYLGINRSAREMMERKLFF